MTGHGLSTRKKDAVGPPLRSTGQVEASESLIADMLVPEVSKQRVSMVSDRNCDVIFGYMTSSLGNPTRGTVTSILRGTHASLRS